MTRFKDWVKVIAFVAWSVLVYIVATSAAGIDEEAACLAPPNPKPHPQTEEVEPKKDPNWDKGLQ